MIRYLIDSSALWRLDRDKAMYTAWQTVVTNRTVASCHPQRAEFRQSARHRDEYEWITKRFHDLYPDVPVPKTAWRWIEAAQYRLLGKGAHRMMSVPDLLVAATAAHHGRVVLHDDRDFATAACYIADLREHRVADVPV